MQRAAQKRSFFFAPASTSRRSENVISLLYERTDRMETAAKRTVMTVQII